MRVSRQVDILPAFIGDVPEHQAWYDKAASKDRYKS